MIKTSLLKVQYCHDRLSYVAGSAWLEMTCLSSFAGVWRGPLLVLGARASVLFACRIKEPWLFILRPGCVVMHTHNGVLMSIIKTLINTSGAIIDQSVNQWCWWLVLVVLVTMFGRFSPAQGRECIVMERADEDSGALSDLSFKMASKRCHDSYKFICELENQGDCYSQAQIQGRACVCVCVGGGGGTPQRFTDKKGENKGMQRRCVPC